MSVINNNLLLTPEGYQISRSVRLRSSASGYFNRTPAGAGSRTTFTWSHWCKVGTLGVRRAFVIGNTNTNANYLEFDSSNRLSFVGNDGTSPVWIKTTSQVFRDPSAWYHIVAIFDSTNATAADRVRLYVNGDRVAAFASSTDPTLNYNTFFNQGVQHDLGRIGTAGFYFDGYLTEVNFIDGQALTPSSFGETDAVTGVWKPKKYAGTYGTNGFYLNFSDNSAATAAAIGKDSSGNGNNWTPNNISVTAGVTYDSMLDVPTMLADGGNGRGNYCVLNPLKRYTANPSITAGNLTASDTSASVTSCVATMSTGTSGKYYFECTMTAVSSNSAGSGSNYIGVTNESNAVSNAPFNNGGYRSGNPIYNLAGAAQTAGSTYTTGDVIGVAIDVTSGTVQFYKNNVAQGATPSFTFTAGTELWPFATTDNVAGTKTFDFNFGQRPFTYTPPTGFKALNTQNLPEATIKKGTAYFDATTYTGTGASLAVTNGGFQPDLVWLKSRSNATSNALIDAVRGPTKVLYSQATDAESTWSDALASFDANGFTIAANSTFNTINVSPRTYVGWQWKESASAGFDIVTYTGNGANRTVAHSLGVVPSLIILKARSSALHWPVYHTSMGAANLGFLDMTNAWASSPTTWNSTVPTSSVFSLGTDATSNQNGTTFVAYLFAEVAGFSKMGSYTGNGSADGPFVYCGFKPRFVLIKNSSAAGSNWAIWDTARSSVNQMQKYLLPNLSAAEGDASTVAIDALANGFKLRGTDTGTNGSGNTIIFAAFAESPFKNSLAR